MSTFALEGLFDEVRRLTYADWMGSFQTVASNAARDALTPKTAGMLVLVQDDTQPVADRFYQLGQDLVTWTEVQNRVTVIWGRREPQKSNNIGSHGRIVLVPNSADGALGVLEDAEQPGRIPRPLYSQERKFHFLIFGRDEAKLNVDRGIDHIVEILLHETVRNVWLASHHWGDAQVTSPVVLEEPRLSKPQQQLPQGFEYMLPGTVQSAVVDQFDDLAEFTKVSPLAAKVSIPGYPTFTAEP